MSNGKFPVLIFDHSGFCEELNCSYFQGRYQARTKEQYEALKKHAVGENKPAPVVSSDPEDLQSLTVPKLREMASGLGVENYAKKKKPALIKAIEEKLNPAPAEEEAEEVSGDPLADQEEEINLEGE